ncbi:FYVE, RhoGEF and PH domain-containing protein 5 isoform X2 [Takifugu rubripes]|uniref:FYVE, RhoGEF and PH domain-containing protein 5 isoform X2 n=1 Tax=Takifugu rubripes TaxID=31033 RepID=UPI0005D1B80B|nr:FYVE, RhoGEF and PH domain-containing protein 5-like isoform X2 [Takifugu rubripes]|eukprot:XP_011612379.1 PREDICTED: FYVE, RhoGEF and PH domain-containing protein 5-like isoform X2 [Takifugu rubripes]
MNADFQNPLQVPRPKVRSHLTIRVQSKLMSRPCPPVHGPKPPVAPKPGYVCEQLGPLQSLSNGDVTHSDSETDEAPEIAEQNEDGEKSEGEDGASESGVGSCRKEDMLERDAEKERDIDVNMSGNDGDSVGSDDTVKADDVSSVDTTEDKNTEKDLNHHTEDDNASTISLPDTLVEDETGEEADNEEDVQSDKTERLCASTEPSDEHVEEASFDSAQSLADSDSCGVHEVDCGQSDCPHCAEPELEPGGFAFGFSVLPTVTEEYTYDVIGPTDDASDTCESCDPGETGDAEVWQPERATKDLSGCFRFTSSTEDVFGPYSVIEAVPADVTDTADPDWSQDDTDDQPSGDMQTVSASVQEPYYVSSQDVDKLEKIQENVETEEAANQSDQHKEKVKDGESADEYADIDDSLCNKADEIEQGVSSEDYVEIGDEDEEEENEKKHIKGKSAKERTAQREQAFLNKRASCQPRLRLCNITVPADLDLGCTPELTNRMVFAHTTEAFEEDIEELDCHIVPYYEDTDSDSEEHIYEEAGFDSEGENFLALDRKTVVTRSRSYSGKFSGYVPETVPEETGTEYQTHDYCSTALNSTNDASDLSRQPGVNSSILPMKSRRFLLYSRSAEGPELSLTSPSEVGPSLKDELRMKRKDDNLSLPCVMSSSGSFSQRSHQSSSGVSTPTSLVDIPPPFELAYIIKRPVTKSSPSLFIHHEPSDINKKKKSSFKRFLALKFKKKSDSKSFSDGSVRSSRSSSESSHHGPGRVIELDRRSASSSPRLQSNVINPQQRAPDMPSAFVQHHRRKSYGRGVSRVESFEERSRRSPMPLPLTKPRSISFPSADTSDYENIPAMSSDYENIQIPGRPARSHTVTEFFEDTSRTAVPCNENDGYVDMNSFPGIDTKPQMSKADAESAYTEPFPMNSISALLSADEAHGRTSEEEEGAGEPSCDRQIDGRSRAFYIAKELADSERLHVSVLKHLQEDFRSAVTEAEGEEGGPVLEEQRLGEILGVLPQVYALHSSILTELEEHISQWDDNQSIVNVLLSRREDFRVFDTYISEYDRSMSLLEESCRDNLAFASIVKKFEKRSPEEAEVPLKHQLLQVIVRVLQYRMLLTDYLNNLSPDSKEYEDTQAALVIVSEVSDEANDNLKQGENLLRLVHIEYSLKGKRDLLKAGRMFVKEGTLMKVLKKSRLPRHLFLMNDIMLYTYPQQDGKYLLKNTLSLSGMKVSKPVIDDVLNCLRIEVSDITITLSASSVGEREDWFHTLSRAIADHAAGLCTFGGPCSEAREKLWMALGEAAPVLVPVSHVMMCMNCTTDFSLTLRRHHCNACGKVVCRACSRNRYPLKYLKDRVAKVCDHCYAELRKKGGSVSVVCSNSSPRTHRASRPLSAVFQSLQPPSLWKNKKCSSSLNQVSLALEGSTMSGSLQRRKKSKRKWKRLWFLLKDKDKVASESLPLQGFTVKLTEKSEGEESSSMFQLYHKKTLYYTFRADDHHTARRWVNAMEEATVL